MRSIRPALARLFAVAALLLLAETGRADAPPEPESYRLEDYRSPTPPTLRGATVLDTRQAAALWKTGSAVFVDVLPRAPKPANLPPGTLWRDPPHDSLPGAVWLPNTGYGALSADTESYFRRSLDEGTKGDLEKPIVFFCQRNCWMSWNAAKHALEYGYRHVSWFPDGTDGWLEAGLPLRPIEPSVTAPSSTPPSGSDLPASEQHRAPSGRSIEMRCASRVSDASAPASDQARKHQRLSFRIFGNAFWSS